VLVPDEPVDLPKDQPLELEIRPATDPPRGSPQALLKHLRSRDPIPQAWIDDLEQSIREGKMPVRYEGIFDEDR
jgi:hypothetical protein